MSFSLSILASIAFLNFFRLALTSAGIGTMLKVEAVAFSSASHHSSIPGFSAKIVSIFFSDFFMHRSQFPSYVFRLRSNGCADQNLKTSCSKTRISTRGNSMPFAFALQRVPAPAVVCASCFPRLALHGDESEMG